MSQVTKAGRPFGMPEKIVLSVAIVEVDPQGEHALGLLREAAIEARALYPELTSPNAEWPTNDPTPPRGIYLVAYAAGLPVACGALRPIAVDAVEIRRLFVTRAARRKGLARAMLNELEARARQFGYAVMRLETSIRQVPAISLYKSFGFRLIPAFGAYTSDPVSVCFEKHVAQAGAGGA